MAVVVKMPLSLYLGFLGRCRIDSREYAALKNAIVEHEPEDLVKIMCDDSGHALLAEHAKRFYTPATPFLENLNTGELRIVATEYRRQRDLQTWHFCSNCSHWPTETNQTVTASGLPGYYEICNECIVLNQQGDCK